jgi:hypothetical protein
VFRRPARLIESVSSRPPKEAEPERLAGRSTRTSATTSGGASDAADVSAEFRSEFAALLAFYAARIAAARASLDPSVAAAIVQALMNEQSVALRALTDRQHAASQKQRDERPERPTGNVQRKDDGPKPS